ncbi:MAG: hypothetical protein AAFR31_10745 [Cyanobacteria bacterium J06627_8]
MKTPHRLAEKRAQAEHLQDVKLLLDHLARSQETTIKLILDSLYEVGAVNFINQKVQSKSLNRLSKSAASVSKPVFRIIAYRWFKNKCPELITNWLHRKVSFGVKPASVETVSALDAQTTDTLPAVALQHHSLNHEVKQLRSQVRLLTGMLIGAIALLGGTTLWLIYGTEPGLTRLREGETSTVTDTLKAKMEPQFCLSDSSSECQNHDH